MDLSLLGFSGFKDILNIHPAFVHFPIALIPSAFLFYFLGIILKKPSLCVAGRACLYAGSLGAVFSLATGLMAESTIPHNDTVHMMMQTHKKIGFALLTLLLILIIWSFRHETQKPKAIWPFLAALGFASFLALQNGDLGSRMVYIEGAGVKPTVPIVHSSPQSEEVPRQKKTISGHDHKAHSH